jgi:methylase of polypeptide subunit release factors
MLILNIAKHFPNAMVYGVDIEEITIAKAKENQRLSRACIVHLVIKKNNWSYVKTMSCVILELRST